MYFCVHAHLYQAAAPCGGDGLVPTPGEASVALYSGFYSFTPISLPSLFQELL